ncbi:MAG TPA: sigma-70 family RNA polymerase sigma factor [Verrucomicrobiae bacterium]
MSDFDLLHEYVSRSSDQAFGALVERYTNLVYSAALRQTRNAHKAEEITQVVFVILARKAGTMGKNVILPGWLLRTTRFVALNAFRRDQRRRRTEEQAAGLLETNCDDAWKQIAPALDDALYNLKEKDRNAVALRFFEQKSYKEIAHLLGTSEDGAQKRVTRALEKLRASFVRNGVVLPTTVVAVALTARAVQAAPSGLPAAIVTAVFSPAAAPSLVSFAMAALERARVKELTLKLGGIGLLCLLALVALRGFAPERAASPGPGNNAPGLTLGGNPSPRLPAADTSAALNPGQLVLRVLDAGSDAPLRNAKLKVIWDTGFPNIATNLLSTDRQGESSISFPAASDEVWNLRIEIIKEGYVPRFVSWAAGRGDLLGQIPSQYTTRLDPGTVVAGFVLNESGEPIPDVQIGVRGPGPATGPEPPPEREGLALSHTETTDAQGRWFCDHLPPQLQPVIFSLSHPEYVAASFRSAKIRGSSQPGPIPLSEEDLRDGTAVVVLKRGRVATGIVMDEQGQPISGAQVTRDRLYSDPTAMTLTAADGVFKFSNITGGEQLVVTAQADGFLPADVTLPRTLPSEALRIVLHKAAVLRGRVLDSEAHPVGRATVLPVSGDYASDRFHWSTITDAQGRFAWLSAPALPLRYGIWGSGYDYLQVDLPADGAEHIVTLRKTVRLPPVRISGRVADLHSGQLIPEFQVWTAVTLRRGSPSGFATYAGLARKLTTTGENGCFAFLAPTYYADPIEKLDLEVRASGYSPARQTLAGPLTNASLIGFELAPLGGLAGVVQLPDGEPAPGAVVVACALDDGFSGSRQPSPRVYITLPGEFDLRFSSANRSETDSNGAFTLKTKPLTGMLFVAHRLGYAEVPLDRLPPSSVIKLGPWGSVSGTLRVGKSLGTNRTVFLCNRPADRTQFVSLALTATTDEAAHFSIEGVPPGDWRLLPHGIGIRVTSGERTDVTVGGGGLRIVGKTSPAAAVSGAPDEQLYRLSLRSRVFPEAAPGPVQFPSPNELIAARAAWFKRKLAFLQTEAGRDAFRTSRDYTPVVAPDGTFLIDEVLPGVYDLTLEPNRLRSGLPMCLLDDVVQEVVVPKPTEVTGDTLDVGTVDLELAASGGTRP